MRLCVSLPALALVTTLSAASTTEAHAAPPWVDRTLTLPSGDWAFDFGFGVAHIPPPPPGPVHEVTAGANMELAVGVTDRVELGLRSALRFGQEPDRGVEADRYGRLFDRQTFDTGAAVIANPEFRVTGAIVRDSVIELALQGRVVLPFEAGTAAGFLFGVPLALHLADILRLDVGVYTPVVFYRNNTQFGVHLPADLWIQANDRLWLGPMTGVELDSGGVTNVSLGFGLGYQIAHSADFKTMFLFPEINHQGGDFGIGAGLEIRIE
jgi:hypothetical protein